MFTTVRRRPRRQLCCAWRFDRPPRFKLEAALPESRSIWGGRSPSAAKYTPWRAGFVVVRSTSRQIREPDLATSGPALVNSSLADFGPRLEARLGGRSAHTPRFVGRRTILRSFGSDAGHCFACFRSGEADAGTTLERCGSHARPGVLPESSLHRRPNPAKFSPTPSLDRIGQSWCRILCVETGVGSARGSARPRRCDSRRSGQSHVCSYTSKARPC